MELKDLVGEHVLSGVDRSSISIDKFGDGEFDVCEVFNFVLDGKTYTAIEDPVDKCGSCMREIKESNEPVSNIFEGQRVLARMRDGESDVVLDLLDLQTGKIVLSVGTGNTGDYYPYWVAKFNPENMGINQEKDK